VRLQGGGKGGERLTGKASGVGGGWGLLGRSSSGMGERLAPKSKNKIHSRPRVGRHLDAGDLVEHPGLVAPHHLLGAVQLAGRGAPPRGAGGGQMGRLTHGPRVGGQWRHPSPPMAGVGGWFISHLRRPPFFGGPWSEPRPWISEIPADQRTGLANQTEGRPAGPGPARRGAGY